MTWWIETGGRQHHTPTTLLKAFHEEPVVCFLEVDKAYVDVFCILPRFLKNLLESENLVCSATAGMQTALGIIQLWFNYFTACFFKAVGNVNVNYLKLAQQHRRPHKTPLRASCLRPWYIYEWFWFGVPEFYSIQQLMRLTNMQLTGVVYICYYIHIVCTISRNENIVVLCCYAVFQGRTWNCGHWLA